MLRTLSVTQRLTGLFTAFAAVLVIGLGLVFIQATAQHFVELDRVALLDKKHLIEGIVQSAHSVADARSRLNEALNHHHGLYVEVQDARGQSLYQTRGFQAPPAAWAAASRPSPPDPAALSVEHWEAEGRSFRSMGFGVVPAYGQASPLRVLAAIDTAHHEHFLTGLRATLWRYALLAVVFSGLLSWLAAHQGLAPLRAMRAKAAAVSGHQFSERMPVEAVPIEMADLAAELNAMLERLQEDYQRLAEFSSDLAHELRTPISNLLTQTQVALSVPREAAAYGNILASNAEELERLARMVADMLFLAKAERGMALPQRETFRLAPEVLALLDFYDAVAEEKGIRFRLAGDAAVEGDPLMVRRALSNLLSNAVRHSDPGAPITVTIDSGAHTVCLRVENLADDLDPAVLPRLFDRFYRADPSRAHPSSAGAGLGLSITRAIVSAHGGQISATSQGRRFCVEVSLPAAGPTGPRRSDSHRDPPSI